MTAIIANTTEDARSVTVDLGDTRPPTVHIITSGGIRHEPMNGVGLDLAGLEVVAVSTARSPNQPPKAAALWMP